MEEVGFTEPPISSIVAFCRVLRNEYRQTRNQSIRKARFPSLLSQLWKTKAITNKTNIVKSFIKAGVFPLDPASVDRSRLLRNSPSSDTPPTGDQNSVLANSLPVVVVPTITASIPSLNGHRQSSNTITIPVVDSFSFTTSHEAISALDTVLEHISSTTDDDDGDDDYSPNNLTTSTTITSHPLPAAQQTTSEQPTVFSGHRTYSRLENRASREPEDQSNLDDSDSSEGECWYSITEY